MIVIVALAAALAGFLISFAFWRWILGDRNWIEGTIVSLPLAVVCGALVPAADKILAAAERAQTAKHDRAEVLNPTTP